MSRSTTPGAGEHISQYNADVRAERCYFCPARHNLQTHHIVPQRKNGSDARENLVIVCQQCHQKLERLYDKRFYERLGLTDNQGDHRSHYACLRTDCPRPGTVKVKTGEGAALENWFCQTHAEGLIDDGATVIQEAAIDA